jgi:phage shock protein A
MSEASKDKHEQALDLTEQALEALDKGDEKQADKLIEKAKDLDPSAPAEIVQDLEEG